MPTLRAAAEVICVDTTNIDTKEPANLESGDHRQRCVLGGVQRVDVRRDHRCLVPFFEAMLWAVEGSFTSSSWVIQSEMAMLSLPFGMVTDAAITVTTGCAQVGQHPSHKCVWAWAQRATPGARGGGGG